MTYERCIGCNRVVQPWIKRTIERVSLPSRQDLKMDYTYRSRHWPNCENPAQVLVNESNVVKEERA